MKKIWKPLVLLLVLGLIAADLYFDYRSDASASANSAAGLPVGTDIGELAPDFSATSLDGQAIRLSDFRGKIVLINNFASWCGPCLAETPDLVESFNANQDEVVFIGLNFQETESAVVNYRDDFNVTYPLLLDPGGNLTQLYRPIGLPTSWFINPNGVVHYVHPGPMTSAVIQEVLAAVKQGRQPDLFAASN